MKIPVHERLVLSSPQIVMSLRNYALEMPQRTTVLLQVE